MTEAGDSGTRPVGATVLGPLSVRVGEETVVPHGAKERTLLALLVARAGQAVAAEVLIDVLWGDAPPRSADKALQVYVARVRRALEPARPRGGPFDVLVTESNGYRLRIDPASVDAERFVQLVTKGRDLLAAGDAAAAAATLEEGLALWKGRPYDDVDAGFADLERARLGEHRAAAFEDFTTAQLALGRSSELVPGLEAAVDAEPFRERLWANLMVALYRSGRQADALRAFQRARTTLVEELGVEPGPELRDLEAAILDHDRALLGPSPSARTAPPTAATEPDLAWLEQLWDDLASGRRRIVSVRRLRLLGAAVAAAVVVAVIVGLVAVDRTADAERSESRASRAATVADANRLAARARSASGSDTDLSLLLAVQARRLHPSTVTEGTLEAVLAATPPGLEHTLSVGPDAGFAAITNDGRRVAVPQRDGSVELIELATGERASTQPPDASSPGVAAAFSGDDRRLAVGSEDGRVRILDARGRPLRTPVHAGSGPALAVFDPTDPGTLFTTAGDGSVSAWDVDARPPRQRALRQLARSRNDALPTSLSVSGDGGRLIVGDAERGPAVVLGADDGAEIATVDGRPGAIDATGGRVAVVRGTNVEIVDAETGAVTNALAGLRRPFGAMSFDSSGEILAVADGFDSTVHVFEVESGAEVGPPIALHDTTVAPVLLGDGRLFTRSAERVALLGSRDVAVSAPGRVIGTEGGFVSVQAAFDRSRMATLGPGYVGRLWTLDDRPVPTSAGPDGRVLMYRADLRQQLTIAKDGSVRVAGLDGEPLATVGGPGWFWYGWSPDGALFVVGSPDGLELRRARAGGGTQRVAILEPDLTPPPDNGQIGYLTTAWFSPDSRRVAILKELEGVASVYLTVDGGHEYDVELPGTQRLRALTFDRSGAHLAVAGGNERTGSGVIEVRETRTGEVQETYPLEFDPNGIALVNRDRWFAALRVARFSSPGQEGSSTIHLLDRATAQPVGEPLGFAAGAAFGATGDEGRAVVFGSDRGFATVWQVDPQRWARTACALSERTLTRAEWDRYLPDRPYDPPCR